MFYSEMGKRDGICKGVFAKLLGVGSITLLACNLLTAQINTGSILGTVTDQSGGVIAGATVTVTN